MKVHFNISCYSLINTVGLFSDLSQSLPTHKTYLHQGSPRERKGERERECHWGWVCVDSIKKVLQAQYLLADRVLRGFRFGFGS